jgi:ParB-like chromosome segregation protein Spo0J
MKRVPLSQIRAGKPASPEGVAMYRAAIPRGEKLRPLILIRERPGRYRVFDGFHRKRAMRLEKIKHADAVVMVDEWSSRAVVHRA